MDMAKGFIDIYLHDPNGIMVGGVNYKIAKGAKLRMLVKEYPVMKLNYLTDKKQNSSVPLSTTSTFLTDIGKSGIIAPERPTITITAYILISEYTPTKAQLFDGLRVWKGDWNSTTSYTYTSSPESKDLVLLDGKVYACVQGNTNQTPPNTTYWEEVSPFALDYYTLFNMWLFNHKYYLTDLKPGVTDKTNFGSPINILANRQDMLGRNIFSSLGVPVIINSITPGGEFIVYSEDGEKEHLMQVTIELMVDN